jgi:DNA polymerase
MRKLQKAQRFIGKTSQLGLIFGVGAAKLREAVRAGSGTDLGEVESKRIVDLYRETYKGVVAFWKVCQQVIDSMVVDDYYAFGNNNLYKLEGNKGVKLPSGLYMHYPHLMLGADDKTNSTGYFYKVRNGYDRLYGGKLTNNLVQATARCIMAEAMIRISKKYKIALCVHDALYIVVEEDKAQQALDYVISEMCQEPTWMPGIPLAAEGGFGRSIADC